MVKELLGENLILLFQDIVFSNPSNKVDKQIVNDNTQDQS